MKKSNVLRVPSVDVGYEMLFCIPGEIASDPLVVADLLDRAKKEAIRLNALDHASVEAGGDGGCDEDGASVQECFKKALLGMGFTEAIVLSTDFCWDEHAGN